TTRLRSVPPHIVASIVQFALHPKAKKAFYAGRAASFSQSPSSAMLGLLLRSGFGGPEVYCGHMPKLVIQDGHQSPSREASLVTRSEGGSRREVGQSKSVVHAACLSVQ